jgi:acyl-[acyl-carrier-protein] desaturase
MTTKLPHFELGNTNELFLNGLGEEAERLLNRHDETAKIYYPFDVLVDVAEAREKGEYHPENAPLDDAVKKSLFINLETEEGLPYYTSTLDHPIPKRHPLREWLQRWTAEEGRHAPQIINIMYSTGQFDMHELERTRMAMMNIADTPQFGSLIESSVYPAFQEPATVFGHRNTMARMPSEYKIAKKALALVVGDEVRHGIFYRDLVTKAIEIDPSSTVMAIAQQIKNFRMPGKGIPHFEEYKEVVENAGIFGPSHLKEIFDDLVTSEWNIGKIANLSSVAEQARTFIFDRLALMGKLIDRKAQQKAERTEA